MQISRHFSSRSHRRTMLLTVAISGLILTGVWSFGTADLVAPRPNDRRVTIAVMSLLNRDHLSQHPLDDEISRRALKSYLEALDPMKMYFVQSDVDEFMGQQDELDDMLNDRELGFAYTVYKRFLQRVDERLEIIEQLLKQDFDFTREEYLVTDPDAIQYARNAEEAEDRWRRRIKYDLLVLKSSDEIDGDEARERLSRRYTSFGKRMYQTDADELLEIFLTSVTSSYDPHTTYMSASSLENFRIQMRLNLEGIGAALQVIDGYTQVSKIIPGGAADRHGKLKPEDQIVSVGQGKDGEMVDVVDMKLGDVVKLIRGDAGTIVRLGVVPAAGGDMQTYEITRAKIELKDSEARGEIIEEGRKEDGSPLRIGVIDLPSFYMDMEGASQHIDGFKSTTRDVRKILGNFNSEGVDVVVLDLRRNGGGSLTEAIDLTGLFIDRGPVVQVKAADGPAQVYDDKDSGMAWTGPLVVLTSKFSASASEILAGAIQDYNRGLVIGDTSTHGKGTVQSLLDLSRTMFPGIRLLNPPELGALKITMQQFYRPNGDSTQKRGVLADIALPSITDHMDVSEADLDYAVEFDRIDATRFTDYRMVSDGIVEALGGQSKQRIGESDEFAKLLRNIDRYKTQKAKKRVSLNEQAFMKQREEIDADQEEEKQFEEQALPSDEVVKRDFYFNEVLAIAADYVRLLENNQVARLQ